MMRIRIEVEVADLNDLEGILKALPGGIADRMTIEPLQEEVPEVEVTPSSLRAAHGDAGQTYVTSIVPVAGFQGPLEGRRSGAKNVSDPIYQNAFISEARRSMGQPDVAAAQALIGRYVKLTFNIDWHPAKGVLTDVVEDKAPYLMLDNYHERHYPLYAIQTIEELPHHPSAGL